MLIAHRLSQRHYNEAQLNALTELHLNPHHRDGLNNRNSTTPATTPNTETHATWANRRSRKIFNSA